MPAGVYPAQDFNTRSGLPPSPEQVQSPRQNEILGSTRSSRKKNNEAVEIAFLDTLSSAISPQTRVVIVTDAGFQSAWFRHIKLLGWDLIDRIRG